MTYGWGSRYSLFTHLAHLICTVLVTGLVVFVACVCVWYNFAGGGWRGAVSVNGATYLYPYGLSLGVGSCLGSPEVTLLRETDHDVQIKVVAFTRPFHGGLECAEGVAVRLQEPLGDRIVVDGHTGQRVKIRKVRPSSAQPSPDWRVTEAPGWPSQPGLSLQLPTGWELNELQGIDSHVGEVTGDGVRLTLDYGVFPWSLNPARYPAHTYIVAYQRVGGFDATLFISMTPGEGFTGVYFPDLGGLSLHLVGEDLTPCQQETAIALFRSIRLLGHNAEDAGDAGAHKPGAPSQIDDLMVMRGRE